MSTAASTSAEPAGRAGSGSLWIRRGRLIDLASGAETDADVVIEDGTIVALGSTAQPDGPHQVVDAAGQYVVPGLVDLHAHVFDGVGDSVAADRACLGRGTVTVVDGGSAGAASIDAFRRVSEGARTEILAWLNLSTIGLIDTNVGELVMGPHLDPDAAVRAARRHPGFVVGIKARLSTYAAGGGAIRILRVLREVADELSLPVMVHIGDTIEPLDELVVHLRPGDVVTHGLTGRKHGILDGRGTIRPAILEAQRQGVVFDAARGRNHVSFPVLARALDQGFLPDTLSTDMTVATEQDPAYGLGTLITYLLAYDVRVHEAVSRATIRPSAVFGRQQPASLEPGQRADLTIAAIEPGPFTLEDVDGQRLTAARRFVPTGVVRAGAYAAVPGAG